MSDNLLHLDSASFNDLLTSDKPALVDFWATWCGPCRAIAPLIEEIADELAGKANVGKVDIDKSSDLANQYRIQSIPTIIAIKDGKEIARVIGANPKAIRELAAKLGE